jgi:kumamolisin
VYTESNYTGSTCRDHFYVRLRTTSGTTISTVQSLCQSNNGYTQYTFNVTSALSSYVGKSIEVYFLGTTSSSDYSSFFLDDTALNVTY